MQVRRRARKVLQVGAVEEKERRKVKVGGLGIAIVGIVQWTEYGGRSSPLEPVTNMDARSSVLAAVSVQDLLAAFEDPNGISKVMKMYCYQDVVMYIPSASDLLMSAKCCRRNKSVSPIKIC